MLLVAMLCALASPHADAQWKWRDKTGQVTVSDVPPPKDIAEKDILQRPEVAVQRRSAAPAVPQLAASAALAASAPASPLEAEVEARKRKGEQEQKAKEKAAEETNVAARAENCGRAKSHLRALEDGLRMARVNDKGEREVLDDKARAAEVQRSRAVIASDCK